MFGDYFYNEVLRKTVVGFGTLFNNLEISRFDSAGNVTEVSKVPLSYGPTQKFLARIQQQPNLTGKDVQIVLPRMSFEILGMQYDPSRKLAPLKTTITPKEGDANKIVKQFMPVPYNVNFELAIYVKNQDDGLQIIEQILPFFQPSFSITVKMIKETDEKRDIPIVLNSIDYRDEYEGNFDKRQVIIWTLQFTAKTYLFGPTADSGVIRTAITNFYSDTATTTARREVTYTVKPKATTDQDGDGDVDKDANSQADTSDTDLLTQIDDDDFGFSTSISYNSF